MVKFVLVTGGVVSGLGKGITASSVGLLLKESGLRVTSIKIDPYLNVDAGTMSPYEHGECYVLDDGGETDLDLGNYERFLDVNLTRDHNITTGKVYNTVIQKERKGDYLGKTVQMVPHVSGEILNRIRRVATVPVDGSDRPPDICVIELGGTVGDIESMLFLEALRQLRYEVGRDNMCHLHVTLVTVVGAVGEQKSKPTQHSVMALRSVGLIPDLMICRSKHPINRSIRKKVSMFSMVPPSHVISVHDVANIYAVPNMLLQQQVPQLIVNTLHINRMMPQDVRKWDMLAYRMQNAEKLVRIAMVGKYTGLTDSYLSVTKALRAAAIHCDHRLEIVWIKAEDLEEPKRHSTRPRPSPLAGGMQTPSKTRSSSAEPEPQSDPYTVAWERLKNADGILIPGGFGDRGVEGKILAAKYARESKKPFLGICLGMQVAVIEYARNVLGLKDANSEEFDKDTPNKVIMYMPEIDKETMGGNMRLGLRECRVTPKSTAHLLYGKTTIWERHRHRYEVNPEIIKDTEAAGLFFSGRDDQNERMEICELPPEVHPYYFGCQFHPEFRSRPMRVSPPFRGLVEAATNTLDRRKLPGSPEMLAKRRTKTVAQKRDFVVKDPADQQEVASSTSSEELAGFRRTVQGDNLDNLPKTEENEASRPNY